MKNHSVIVAMALVLTLTTCNTNDSNRFDFEWNKSIVKDQLKAEALFVSHFKFLFQALTDSSVVYGTTNSYDSANLSRSGNSITFNYGDGRRCPDGRTRKGTLSLIVPDEFITKPGTSATLTFGDNFYLNGQQIGGSVLLSNLSDTTGSRPLFAFEVTNGIIDLGFDYAYDLRYSCSLAAYWTDGEQSTTPADDQFIIKGRGWGNGREHDQFQTKISDSLYLQPGCTYLRGGKASLTMPGFEVNSGTLDYMSKDTCVAYVKVIFKGTTESGDPVISPEYKMRIEF
ncbi:MAG: hypothetical protein PHQ65_09920 [Bacteroidales bacterium]|nr:hypothetical protein [Bacteroidales bacterium]MDD3665568.1 hypothetical protein [Bacteroidales bacterium]